MINSFKGARLPKLIRNNGPISQGLSSQVGPEGISLVPRDHEINTRAAGTRSLSSAETSGREQSITQPFCPENPGREDEGWFEFQHF